MTLSIFFSKSAHRVRNARAPDPKTLCAFLRLELFKTKQNSKNDSVITYGSSILMDDIYLRDPLSSVAYAIQTLKDDFHVQSDMK